MTLQNSTPHVNSGGCQPVNGGLSSATPKPFQTNQDAEQGLTWRSEGQSAKVNREHQKTWIRKCHTASISSSDLEKNNPLL